ncbi:MAG: AbrB/MazE/SpoVT family DNA-binding domain-containing protein [Lachnospiraceae bacterium]|nr:AbrB/MazE/SpoVT family DNA-binding domain-containing protein [Lachnospiraceae bacterium]
MPALATMPEQKKVTISSKRQFTIPQKFFTKLGFDREAVCTLGNGMLIIEPARSANGGEFAEQILSDLIAEGYNGQELLAEFKSRQSQVRPAVEKMLGAAKDAVNGIGEFYSYEDVFGGKK